MSIITLQASDIPFKIGETLKYKASFSSIPARSAILKVIKKEIINDINTFHIRFKAQTEGFTDLIFPIDDVIYLDMSFEEASKFIVSAGTSSSKN